MDRKKMTPEEFAAKVEWEGGIFGALTYGLSSDDMDDSNPEFKSLWVEAERLWDELEPIQVKVDDLVEGLLDGDL